MSTAQFMSLTEEDDFEVIQAGIDTTYQSIEPSLNDSLVLPPMLVSTTTLVDEEQQNTIRNDQETGLLNSSISIASSHSSDAISSMLRSQSETNAKLEKHIALLEEYSIINQSAKTASSLQSQLDETTARNEQLERELTTTRGQLNSLKTISSTIESEVKEEMNAELVKKDAIISSLSQQVVQLEQQQQKDVQQDHIMQQLQQERDSFMQQLATLQQKDVQQDQMMQQLQQERDSFMQQLATLQRQQAQQGPVLVRSPAFDEVEKLRQENDQLKKHNMELSEQLSSEYAKRLHEKEMRRELNSALDSMALTGAIPLEHQNVTRAVQELMAKSDECEQYKAQVRDLEQELRNNKADMETKEEIIKVLQEDNSEGTRLMAENRMKIGALKQRLEKYGHFSDF